ncbi:hypothetical protein MMC09_007061 [Bachmanniomyces sp. S44760]|nr:hypothetical protein [Bachmanniomyces sp. S44760]
MNNEPTQLPVLESSSNLPGDDIPIALRRKRRSSTGLVRPNESTSSSSNTRSGSMARSLPSADETTMSEAIVKTPTKPKKRVRFSDPGPDSDSADLMVTSSTGLTPFIKKTSLVVDDAPHAPSTLIVAKPRRRKSEPVLRSEKMSKWRNDPSSSSLSSPASGEIQFEPLRQILDNRTKRRLNRNNLSEEINDIEAEMKYMVKIKQEVLELKEELALAKQLGTEVIDETDDVEGNVGNANRIRELEGEIRLMKTVSGSSMTCGSDSPPEDCIAGDRVMGDTTDMGSQEDESNFVILDQGKPQPEFRANETTTQTTLSSSEVVQFQEQLRIQSSDLKEARLELEHICPGETSLGLANVEENLKGFLDILLDRLRIFKVYLKSSEDALKTSQTQESNLRNQFNSVLQQLERARKYSEDITVKNQELNANFKDVQDKGKTAEIDADEKERSIKKLQKALDTYRFEVSKLETILTKSEENQKIAQTKAKNEMDEAVADLECHVAAETRGRREAEEKCEHHLLHIKVLQLLEHELKGVLGDKQKFIRELESELGKANHDREQEVGGLNVKIGELVSTLDEARHDITKLEAERERLIRRVEEERQAGVAAVENIKAEMDDCLERVDNARENHMADLKSRGPEVYEHKGLLTPVSAVRFKDVGTCEGYVEMKRGKGRKKRPDSGVGIMEEDEDVDMLSSDI